MTECERCLHRVLPRSGSCIGRPSRILRGAQYRRCSGMMCCAAMLATVAGEKTCRPSRVRATNGETRAWRRRGPTPEHRHRANDGSWCSARATAYLVVLPMAASANCDTHRFEYPSAPVPHSGGAPRHCSNALANVACNAPGRPRVDHTYLRSNAWSPSTGWTSATSWSWAADDAGIASSMITASNPFLTSPKAFNKQADSGSTQQKEAATGPVVITLKAELCASLQPSRSRSWRISTQEASHSEPRLIVHRSRRNSCPAGRIW